MSKPLVLDQVRILDGTGAPPIADGRVVVIGDRITAAGPRASVPLPEDAEVTSAPGRTVVPGLIDVHVHDPSDANMALYVRCGVTAIRFAGGQQRALLALRDRIERGEITGPRVFSCGHPLDATPHAWPGSYAVDSPIEARRVVRRAVDVEKADAILATHRVTRPVLAAIVETAHELGVPVTGQIWGADARDAAAVGMDGLDNTSRIPEDPRFAPERIFARHSVSGRLATLAQLWDASDRRRLEEIAGLLAERGVTVAPELVSFEAWAGLADAEVKADPDWPAADDPRAVQYDRHNAYIASEWTAEDRATQARAIDRYKEFCLAFHRAGGQLAAGTDLGMGGILLHREIAHHVDAGLTPVQAIRTATRAAASFLGRDDLGHIAAGRSADLVVVDGDPAADVAALRRVERTIVAGRTVYERAPVVAAR
ncbi:MAG: amidohydrolase family protein [Chloroflexi bacterium]|nr:amidohydrolase family protein [Chloroflexota bacterium]